MTDRLSVDLMIESTGGGSMRHVMDLRDALDARGHDARLILSLARAEPGVLDWLAGIDPGRVIRADTSRGPSPRDLPLALRLRGELARAGAGRLLHAHSTKAGFLATLLRGRTAGTVFTPHAYRGMDPTMPPGRKRAIACIETLLSRPQDHVIAVSPEEVAYARGLGVAAERVSYIPNGIDIAGIRARAEAGRRPRSGASVIGFAGRMTYQKNPVLFLETLALLRRERPELRGVMIGDGDLMPAVRARAEELGLTGAVDFLGAVDFIGHMHAMDVLLHTSFYESLPYVLLEAAAGGLAVVAVRNAGSQAIFGAGVPLVALEAEALAAAARPLLAGAGALPAARAAAAAAAADFSIDAMVDRIESVYRAVLSTRAARRSTQVNESLT